MKNRAAISVFLGLVLPAVLAAVPIPADKAIVATVERHIEMPAGQQPMHMPNAVAVDSLGAVFVSDGADNRIVRFGPKGEFTNIIEGGFSQPDGIFVDRSDKLWIADAGNHRVVCTDAGGKVLDTIALPANKDKAAKPTDVLLTPDGSRMYVVDNANHRILIRDTRAGTWTVMGSAGSALGQFQYPFMIAIGEENYVYVTEAVGGRAQMISPTDRWAGQVSRWGVELGQVYRPKGIATNSRGQVFISDSTLCVVQVFSARGLLEGILTDDQRQPLHFQHPMGMCFDASGKLYVVELKANRVAVLSLLTKAGGAP
ncbi:MAG: NHL repeat-containing protein [Tepidisphaeraceae bacterium]|jgi:DNA-binding beta-propeller fold protein YncE